MKEDSWTLRSSTSAATARNTEERHFLGSAKQSDLEVRIAAFNIGHFRDEPLANLKTAVETVDARF